MEHFLFFSLSHLLVSHRRWNLGDHEFSFIFSPDALYTRRRNNKLNFFLSFHCLRKPNSCSLATITIIQARRFTIVGPVTYTARHQVTCFLMYYTMIVLTHKLCVSDLIKVDSVRYLRFYRTYIHMCICIS